MSCQGFRLVLALRAWCSGLTPPGSRTSEPSAGTRTGPVRFVLSLTCPAFVQLTLTPAQQQMLLQQAQAQAQLLAAAVQQHSASQQHSAAGATISASAATPMTQIPLSQPIQIAQVSGRRRVPGRGRGAGRGPPLLVPISGGPEERGPVEPPAPDLGITPSSASLSRCRKHTSGYLNN